MLFCLYQVMHFTNQLITNVFLCSGNTFMLPVWIIQMPILAIIGYPNNGFDTITCSDMCAG
ncbi:hypothetical protein CF113_15215 [Aeromonas veronii]|nr:hypothetical protein CF113_15215 [Aeromonas veronii]